MEVRKRAAILFAAAWAAMAGTAAAAVVIEDDSRLSRIEFSAACGISSDSLGVLDCDNRTGEVLDPQDLGDLKSGLSSPLMQAQYGVAHAEFGHLGAQIATQLQVWKSSVLETTTANSFVALDFIDTVRPTGTVNSDGQVPFSVSARLDGRFGIDSGNPAHTQKSDLILNGFLSLRDGTEGADGEVVLMLPFCFSTIGGPGCSSWGGLDSFDFTLEQTVGLEPGREYQLQGLVFMGSYVSVYNGEACASGLCSAGGHISMENSFRAYVTPQLAGSGLVSDSGHDYALQAIPEPSSLLMMCLGGALLAGCVGRTRTTRA